MSKKVSVEKITSIGLFTALLCILSPFSLPIGPVPISLCTFFVMLSGIVLGWKLGTSSVILYILLGGIGLPVFSSFSGGVGVLIGPTAGYIFGYIPLALCAGISSNKKLWSQVGLLILGNIILYVIGTCWYMIVANQTIVRALVVCIVPFLFGDGVKIICAIVIGATVKKELQKGRLLA